jgi:hypothetical protein
MVEEILSEGEEESTGLSCYLYRSGTDKNMFLLGMKIRDAVLYVKEILEYSSLFLTP